MFKSALRQAKRLFSFYDTTPCFLPPTIHAGRRGIVREGVESISDWKLLPAITSIALLTSQQLARDDNNSSVAVIWYQNWFGMPDEMTLAQMREIKWRRHTHDLSW